MAKKPKNEGDPKPIDRAEVGRKISATHRRGALVVSKRERRERFLLVEELLKRNVSRAKIAQAMRDKYGLGASRAERIVEDVFASWMSESGQRTLAEEKEHQVRRLAFLAEKARTDAQGKELPPEKWDRETILACEREIAKIRGTYDPVRVDVNVRARDAMIALLEKASPEELLRLDEVGARLAIGGGVIDVPALDAPDDEDA